MELKSEYLMAEMRVGMKVELTAGLSVGKMEFEMESTWE